MQLDKMKKNEMKLREKKCLFTCPKGTATEDVTVWWATELHVCDLN